MADTQRIYPNLKGIFERQLEKLRLWQGSARNKELISAFHNSMFARNCSKYRVSKLSAQLRLIGDMLGADFDRATKQDIERVAAKISLDEQWREETRADYRRAIKQFYKWYQDNDPRLDSKDDVQAKTARDLYRYITKELKTRCKLKKIDYSEILTDEDVDKVMRDGCNTIKERAFLKLLHETGCRVGEFLNIKLKDVTIGDSSGWLVVDGKTGERRIPIVTSIPYLVQYLELHPFRNDRESYLWLGDNTRHYHKPLFHRGAQKIIERCFCRAGYVQKQVEKITLENGRVQQRTLSRKALKRSNFHWFRHSRATLLGPKLALPALCDFMGWEKDSQQPRRYCHTSAAQLEEAYLAIHGIEKKETAAQRPLKCVCGIVNSPTSRYCLRCGKPLNVVVVLEDQELLKQETQRRLKLYGEIMADPKLRQEFEEFKRIMQQREVVPHGNTSD